MRHHRANDGRPLDPEWHEFREQARRTAFSSEEFSDQERERFDLDDDAERSAGITGEDNPDSYEGEDTRVEDIDGTVDPNDIREGPTR